MKNKLNEVIAIMAVPVLIFTFLSIQKTNLSFMKPVDFLSSIRATPKPAPVKALKPIKVPSGAESSGDSLIIPDTTVSYFGDLSRFLKAVNSLRDSSGVIHIAYFGDSMIEGDLITQDVRESLQDTYGGSGVGFVPVTSVTAGFRTTIGHTFNNLWSSWNFNERPPEGIRLGPSGYVFKAGQGAEVVYRKAKDAKPFGKISLLYSSKDSSLVHLGIDTSREKHWLSPAEGIQSARLYNGKGCSRLRMEVQSGNPICYGFNFESGPGLYLDNFSFRGNSGIPLAGLSQKILQDFDKAMNYRLIVLHYGLNVVGHDIGNYDWYKERFRKAIRNIRQAFPHADIMLVSVGDKAHRSEYGWNTEPDIPRFVEIQAQLAAEEKIAFWNLYKAMGGYNTMKRWVENENPKLGNMDYTHLNHRGAARVGNLFAAYLHQQIALFSKSAIKKSTPLSFIQHADSK